MTQILPGPWSQYSDVWDTLILAGKEWPGIAKVTVTRANKWDEKSAKGSNNASRTYTGVEPAKVKIELRIWTAEGQYDVIVTECLPLIEPQDEKKRKDPVNISHAVTHARYVNDVTIDSVSGPDDNGDQTWTFTIEATEYRAPTVVASGSKKGATGGNNCAELNQAFSYWANELVYLGSQSVFLREKVAREEAEGRFASAAAARGQVVANDAKISAANNALSTIAEAMRKKNCPLPPSAGGGIGPRRSLASSRSRSRAVASASRSSGRGRQASLSLQMTRATLPGASVSTWEGNRGRARCYGPRRTEAAS